MQKDEKRRILKCGSFMDGLLPLSELEEMIEQENLSPCYRTRLVDLRKSAMFWKKVEKKKVEKLVDQYF